MYIRTHTRHHEDTHSSTRPNTQMYMRTNVQGREDTNRSMRTHIQVHTDVHLCLAIFAFIRVVKLVHHPPQHRRPEFLHKFSGLRTSGKLAQPSRAVPRSSSVRSSLTRICRNVRTQIVAQIVACVHTHTHTQSTDYKLA